MTISSQPKRKAVIKKERKGKRLYNPSKTHTDSPTPYVLRNPSASYRLFGVAIILGDLIWLLLPPIL